MSESSKSKKVESKTPLQLAKASKNWREGARAFSFVMPSSGPLADGDGEKARSKRHRGKKGGRVVVMLEPNEDIINDSLELAAPWESSGNIVFMSVAQGYQLRLCLLLVDETPIGFDDLEGEGLQQRFNEYERSFLMKGLERISTPPDQEVDSFLRSMRRLG